LLINLNNIEHMGIANKVYNYLSWPPTNVGRKMYKVLGNIDKSAFFVKHLAAQMIFALSSNYFLFHLRNEILEGFGKLDNYLFNSLSQDNPTAEDWEKFESQGVSILKPVLTYIGSSLVVRLCETLYENYINKKIKQNVTAKVFNDNQIGIQLANSEQTAEIVRNIPDDIQRVTSTGLRLVKDAAKNAQDAGLSFITLYNLSKPLNFFGIRIPDLLLFSVVYSGVKQIFSLIFTKKTTALASEVSIQSARANTIMAYDFANVKPIFTAGAQNSASERHKDQINKVDSLKNKYEILSSAYSIWSSLTDFTNTLYKYLIAGQKVFTKLIKSDQVYATFSHFGNVDDFFSWPDKNQAEIKELEPCLDRLQIFLNKEKEIIDKTLEIKYLSSKNNDLLLKDVTLKLGSNDLFRIPKMTFNPGKRYVFSGDSGSGKSSLIAKINGIMHDGIDAKGIIYYPQNMIKKMMLTQDDYFPVHTSLLDIICLPDKVPTDKNEREQILELTTKLLAEISIGRGLHLEEEKTNWSAELSGGQKKKIKVISAIIQKPDLLLLDEVNSGLDHKSTKKVQEMLNKYLPQTTIIAVDHHPDKSNNFYNSHHKVNKDKKIVEHM
jgi:vitamin B12/bleomycin/antimicrobial peptide transport system ATP-binding/permease protein